MSQVLHNYNNNAKAIAIPRVFSEKSQAKNDVERRHWLYFCKMLPP